MNIKNLHNLIKMSVPMLALVMSGAFITSCGDKENDPKPAPTPPVAKNDSILVDIKSMSDLSLNIESMSKKTNDGKTIVIANFSQNTQIATKESDFGVLSELAGLWDKNNFRMNSNGALIVPADEKIILDSDRFSLLNKLWAKGLRFGFNSGTGYMFWADASVIGQASAEQNQNMGNLNADVFTINNASEFGTVCRAAEEAAKTTSINVTLAADIVLDADSLPQIERILNNPKIKVIADDKEISAIVQKHPSGPEIIDCIQGWKAKNPIKYILDGKNAKDKNGNPVEPLGGVPAIVFSNQSFDRVKTAATQDKKEGSFEGIITDQQTGKLTDPVITCFYYVMSNPSNKTVDGVEPIAANITDIYPDTYNNKNGSWPIIAASALKVGNKNIFDTNTTQPLEYAPVLDEYNKEFKIHISENPIYVGSAVYDTNLSNGASISAEFVRIHRDDLCAYGFIRRGLGLGYVSGANKYTLVLQNQGKDLNFVQDTGIASTFFNTKKIEEINLEPLPEKIQQHLGANNVKVADKNAKMTFSSLDVSGKGSGNDALNISPNDVVQRWKQTAR